MRIRNAKWWVRHFKELHLPRWLACLVALFLNLPWTATAQPPATNAAMIELDLAQYVATGHVHANNQPYQWHSLDHMVLYGIDGNPNAYAFVFSKDESRFKGPADLRQHIDNRAAAALAKQGQEAQSSGDNDLFAFDDLATVITGATAESPLILRHFRGAPEFWIEAVKLDASRRAGTSVATQVVMVTPMDFRLVSTEAKAATKVAEASDQAESMPLAASAETIAVHSKKAVRISALRQRTQERQARARKRLESMTPAQKNRHEAALQERRDFLHSQWDSKRAEWENQRSGEEQ